MVWLLDNESTDGTIEAAEPFLGPGLLEIESVAFEGIFEFGRLLGRKEEVIRELEPEWAMHADPDEIRSAPASMGRLFDAIETVERAGANAVNFQEFTFVPTVEHPDHNHADFVATMHWYYAFLPRYPHRLTLFRPGELGDWNIGSTWGHEVIGDGVSVYPVDFSMRHYPVLSADHMDEKYGQRVFDQNEIDRGWHGNRVGLGSDRLVLLRESMLRDVRDCGLDAGVPETVHRVFAPTARPSTQPAGPAHRH